VIVTLAHDHIFVLILQASLYYDRMLKDGYIADESINNIALVAAVRQSEDPTRVLKLLDSMLNSNQAPTSDAAYDVLRFLYKHVDAVKLVSLLLTMHALGTELTVRACDACIRALTHTLARSTRFATTIGSKVLIICKVLT
jgi:hypothetical protein